MGEHERSVAEIVTAKLGDEEVPEPVTALILDAMRESASAVDLADGGQPSGSRRAYLKSISVEGFRGIGPKATLYLKPGPGLTVVTGRNGSGKSSFAEAAELALTGENKRWADRSAVWKEGWRNLHAPESTAIAVQLTEDGEVGTTTVTRDWAAGAVLERANDSVWVGGTERSLAEKGWARPLELYRPFLSYAELGSLVSGKPSSMYDAMQAILGLDLLTGMEATLTEERKSAEADAKAAKNALPALLAKLAAHPDERARQAESAIGGRKRDLAALSALVVADDAVGDGRFGLLRQVTAIALPAAANVLAAVARLVAARAAVAALAGTPAAEARRLVGLLTAAAEHQQAHVGEPCPVCGGRVLDEAWATATKDSIAELTAQAAEAERAWGEVAASAGALGDLVSPKPAVLGTDLGPGLDASTPSGAWDRWALEAAALVSAEAGPSERAGEVIAAFALLSGAVMTLRSAAERVLLDRAAAWQPLARDLAAWSELAEKGEAASVRAKDLHRAIVWLRAIGKEVRNVRLAPFARTSNKVWETLRQESNVELGPITLAGAGPMRKVALDVTVDGVPGAALSVMSQGELHALGLALFLPRATAVDSPFGFVVIDDPVQAMDPAKVDGLARVLSSVAATRQVVVFTHDDRLPAALRQLQLPATVLAVTRRERSEVAVRHVSDPVQRYLEDARAMARTEALSEGVRAVRAGRRACRCRRVARPRVALAAGYGRASALWGCAEDAGRTRRAALTRRPTLPRRLLGRQEGRARPHPRKSEALHRRRGPSHQGAAAVTGPGSGVGARSVTPEELLAAADRLLTSPVPGVGAQWPRACVLLIRLALEMTLDRFWSRALPAAADCGMRQQLLLLPLYTADRPAAVALAREAWLGLAGAAHHHAYELAPTAAELRGWYVEVGELAGLLAAR